MKHLAAALILAAAPLMAEEAMTLPRLTEIVQGIDPEARVAGTAMELTIDDVPVIVITDPTNDARYAVARGQLWGVFIHPLSALEREQFVSALVQTVTVAKTYGQSYSSGAMVFGGGDTNGIYRELFEELLRRGQEL